MLLIIFAVMMIPMFLMSSRQRKVQRQQQEMQLGGLLGSVQLQGDLAPFAQLLHLGQWLHVGKNATMGLGGYRLVV